MKPEIKVLDDGRILVKDKRGYWISMNINKSIPSWKKDDPNALKAW